jgi:sugar lactone lactonase YvrE
MRSATVLLVLALYVPFAQPVASQPEAVDFDSSRWTPVSAQVVDHMGRRSLMGNAYLTDADFENGVIEVDIAVTGARSYPGVVFRAWSPGDYEHVYIRPHRAGLYPDAIQYAPKIKGIASWQLCNGPGYTARAEFPKDRWMHVRIEVKGTQARVFIDDMTEPALIIDHLQHGLCKGGIGVEGPPDGTAYFSDFRYESRNDLVFDPPSPVFMPPGTVTRWEISPSNKVSDIDTEAYPGAKALRETQWQKADCEPDGMVNVARYVTRAGREPDCVIARTIIASEKAQSRKYLFGYSDAVTVFLNGEALFSGESAYQQRDPSFLGIVGLFDAVYLPLEKGDNELLLIVTESFGGWGFMCREADATFVDAALQQVWETPKEFLFPESAVYDAKRNVIYVSNFDLYGRAASAGGQFISRLSPDGEIIEKEWLKGLRLPTGMVIVGDRLYVVERTALVEVDIETAQVANRHAMPAPGFPNDIVADAAGRLYVSDSRRDVVYRFADGSFEEWLGAPLISGPNGLFVDGQSLIVGNSGDNSLKRVDLETKEARVIARLGAGVIDGIRMDDKGSLIVSHTEGRVFRIASDGGITRLLDTTGPGRYTADFEYIAEKNLLAIPGYADGRVVAYRMK